MPDPFQLQPEPDRFPPPGPQDDAEAFFDDADDGLTEQERLEQERQDADDWRYHADI